MRMTKQIHTVFVLAFFLLFGCAGTNFSRLSSFERAEEIAGNCLDSLAKLVDMYSIAAQAESPLILDVLALQNSNFDVVYISPVGVIPDGPYWRCEMSKLDAETDRVEIGKGPGGPMIVDVRSSSGPAVNFEQIVVRRKYTFRLEQRFRLVSTQQKDDTY